MDTVSKTEVQTHNLALEIIEEKADGSYTIGDVKGHVSSACEVMRYYPDEGRVSVRGYGSFNVEENDIDDDILADQDLDVWPANNGARRLAGRSDWSKNCTRLMTLVRHVKDSSARYHDERPRHLHA